MNIDDKEWHDLCGLVANEHDPQKLSKYVDQLIRALDARKRRLHGGKGEGKPTSGAAEGDQ